MVRYKVWHASQGWGVVDDSYEDLQAFRTWREAMDYADRSARTREYVLPRLGAAAIEVLSKKMFIPYSPENAETIALSMLAYRELAEQEES